jgi:hypothetical protein
MFHKKPQKNDKTHKKAPKSTKKHQKHQKAPKSHKKAQNYTKSAPKRQKNAKKHPKMAHLRLNFANFAPQIRVFEHFYEKKRPIACGRRTFWQRFCIRNMRFWGLFFRFFIGKRGFFDGKIGFLIRDFGFFDPKMDKKMWF